MAEMDLRAGLAGAAIPATILVGTRDLITPVRSASSLQQAWPRAGLRSHPGAGHMLPLDRPVDIEQTHYVAGVGVHVSVEPGGGLQIHTHIITHKQYSSHQTVT